MLPSPHLWALALFSSSLAHAFTDTSPFFAFSNSATNTFTNLPSEINVLDGETLTNLLAGLSPACASDAYILVAQPGASIHDFESVRSVPHLSRYLGHGKGDEAVTQRSVVPQVKGAVDLASLGTHLQQHCGASISALNVADGMVSSETAASFPQVLTMDFAPLARGNNAERASQMAERDAYLNAVIHNLGGKTYTVVYTTTPRGEPREEMHAYDMDAAADLGRYGAQGLRVQMRRDVDAHARQEDGDDDSSERGLFEKYNYFNDAVFMGGVVSIVLLTILSAGVSAIAGIDVSYGSFTKEMVNQAKKQSGQN